MFGVVMCIISLLLGNLAVEWLHDAPNYASAVGATWHQLTALLIYYFLWVRPELNKEA